MGAVSDVTDATFADVVLKSEKPVVVDFWADWCGPCKQVSTSLRQLRTRTVKGAVRQDGHHPNPGSGQQYVSTDDDQATSAAR